MDDFLNFDLSDMEMSDAHRLMLHCIAPRPIAIISTLSADGTANLAPYSYFTVGGANPPSVALSSLTDRAGERKNTLRNIEETGEYVLCAVTWSMREQMYALVSPEQQPCDWQSSGFTAMPSAKVRPACVQESPFALECRLHRVVQHGVGPQAANYIIGEVVHIHVARKAMPDGVLDPGGVEYLARMGGDWYARLCSQDLFEMGRPARTDGPGETGS